MAVGKIEIGFELRPCIVCQQRALFHCWEQRSEVVPSSPMVGGHPGGAVSLILGIIEREDGTIHEAYPEEIRFIDGEVKRYFSENVTEEDGNDGS